MQHFEWGGILRSLVSLKGLFCQLEMMWVLNKDKLLLMNLSVKGTLDGDFADFEWSEIWWSGHLPFVRKLLCMATDYAFTVDVSIIWAHQKVCISQWLVANCCFIVSPRWKLTHRIGWWLTCKTSCRDPPLNFQGSLLCGLLLAFGMSLASPSTHFAPCPPST